MSSRIRQVCNVAAGFASAGCISAQGTAAQNVTSNDGSVVTVDVSPVISDQCQGGVPSLQQQLKSYVPRSHVRSIHPPVVEQDPVLFSKREEAVVISKRQDVVVFSKQLASDIQSNPRRLSKAPTRCSTAPQEVKKDEEPVASNTNRLSSVPKEVAVTRSRKSGVVSSKQVIKSTKVASMKEASPDSPSDPSTAIRSILSKKGSQSRVAVQLENQNIPASEFKKQENVFSQRASRSVRRSTTRSTKTSADQIVASERQQVNSSKPPVIPGKPKCQSKTPAPIDQLVSRTAAGSEMISQRKRSIKPDTAAILVKNKRPYNVHSVISKRNKEVEVNTTPASVECILHEKPSNGTDGQKTATTTIRITERSSRRPKTQQQRLIVNYTGSQASSKSSVDDDSVDVHSDSSMVSVARNSRIPIFPLEAKNRVAMNQPNTNVSVFVN